MSWLLWLAAAWITWQWLRKPAPAPQPAEPAPLPPPLEDERLRWVALAWPMTGQADEAFHSAEPSRDPAAQERKVRPALLHLFGLRNDMQAPQLQAALAQQLREGWYRLDLDRPHPDDDLRDAMAFACGRVAFAVRLAGMLGWIDDATQWQLLQRNAGRAQDCFDSWRDFGEAWARGRRQWVMRSRADSLGVPFDAAQVEAWVSDPDHLWGWLSWRPDQPV